MKKLVILSSLFLCVGFFVVIYTNLFPNLKLYFIPRAKVANFIRENYSFSRNLVGRGTSVSVLFDKFGLPDNIDPENVAIWTTDHSLYDDKLSWRELSQKKVSGYFVLINGSEVVQTFLPLGVSDVIASYQQFFGNEEGME